MTLLVQRAALFEIVGIGGEDAEDVFVSWELLQSSADASRYSAR